MRKTGYLLVLLLCVLSLPVTTLSQPAAAPDPATFLSTLRAAHPRLLLTDADLARLREMEKTDATLQKCIRDIILRADLDLERPQLEHKLIGPRLLSVSRECMRRVYSLGLAYRLTGDLKYARACEQNLLTVCAFPDWNPSHFLDTAEMSHAVGIGYDWLYTYLSGSTREQIRFGLIEHGLKKGAAAYREENGVPNWWKASYHNWNQVCNGGLIAGALAIAETDPEYARMIVPEAVKSLPLALATYGPDGAWPDGPGYWHYASRYTSYGLASLESALGTDYGLTSTVGLSVTGFFPIYTTGPTGLYVNFADSGERARRGTMPCLFWLARRFGEQFLADAEHGMIEKNGARPEHIVWYIPPSKDASYNPDLDRLFNGSVEVAVFRSAWNDPDALFVGFKAGYNQVNHGHLDLGNFELDALGVRWARDLGSDNYNLPDYWGRDRDATRWTYYRLNSYSHSVCTLNGKNQDVMAEASFASFFSTPDEAYAVVDLTSAYTPVSKKTRRGIRLVGGRRAVLVRDEFEIAESCDLAWAMTTDAVITVDGNTATLAQDGKKLTARILSPANAVFTVESAEQKPPEKTNRGVRRLMIRMKPTVGTATVAVLLSPRWPDGKTVETAALSPLSEWK